MGFAPDWTIAEIVAAAVFATVMISSLSAIFIDLKDNVNASVPLPTPIPYLQLLYSANSSSYFPLWDWCKFHLS